MTIHGNRRDEVIAVPGSLENGERFREIIERSHPIVQKKAPYVYQAFQLIAIGAAVAASVVTWSVENSRWGLYCGVFTVSVLAICLWTIQRSRHIDIRIK